MSQVGQTELLHPINFDRLFSILDENLPSLIVSSSQSPLILFPQYLFPNFAVYILVQHNLQGGFCICMWFIYSK
ncbi:hypothetical protein HAX54_022131 [Datura stramonium]|uniref:Uncharacterized protein n=1 Tax=Datura stramonium TaxID=4076 RepID=A0ABS8S3Y7_DATST|nr:hypothetical protein [Datura stramonium]